MLDYQESFIQFVLKEKVIRFGNFTLKSGRQSPFFFNSSLLNTGETINKLGQFYATALVASGIDFDILFGAAYKGIPLVTATAIALTEKYQRNTPWCFNRKEIKTHGEGGNMVGAPLQGNTVIIDDTITAGTAVHEIMNIMDNSIARPAAVLIAFDRQEKGNGELSAIQDIEKNYGIPVISIIKLEHLLEHANNHELLKKHASAIRSYRNKYGA